MFEPSRRAFLAISSAGLCAVSNNAALAYQPATTQIPRDQLDIANALNLRVFLGHTDTVGLAGVVAMAAVEGALGSYDIGSVLLHPFARATAAREAPAFLARRDTVSTIVRTAAMNTCGLAPDESFCHYVLGASPASFAGFELGAAISQSTSAWPWHDNISLGGETVGVYWTSSNLNHPWFAGSRWIPDGGTGAACRARIADALHRAARNVV